MIIVNAIANMTFWGANSVTMSHHLFLPLPPSLPLSLSPYLYGSKSTRIIIKIIVFSEIDVIFHSYYVYRYEYSTKLVGYYTSASNNDVQHQLTNLQKYTRQKRPNHTHTHNTHVFILRSTVVETSYDCVMLHARHHKMLCTIFFFRTLFCWHTILLPPSEWVLYE